MIQCSGMAWLGLSGRVFSVAFGEVGQYVGALHSYIGSTDTTDLITTLVLGLLALSID